MSLVNITIIMLHRISLSKVDVLILPSRKTVPEVVIAQQNISRRLHSIVYTLS